MLGAGLVIVGFLAGAYVVYRLLKGSTDVSGFLPTKYPNFKMSPAVEGVLATAKGALSRPAGENRNIPPNIRVLLNIGSS